MSTSSKMSSKTEVKTAQGQYVTVVKTIRGICQHADVIAAFDCGYREGLATFDVSAFLQQGCRLLSSDLKRAVISGCTAAVSYIRDLPASEKDKYNSIQSQLSSQLITVALDSLDIAKPVTVLKQTSPAPPQPSAPVLPTRTPSESELESILAAIPLDSVHYRGCPNIGKRCLTCVSAFQLLDCTPCNHKSAWCTSVGYYPHFNQRLQRRFRVSHIANCAISELDLKASSTGSEPGEIRSESPHSGVPEPPEIPEAGPSGTQPSSPPLMSWGSEVELDAADRMQATISCVREEMGVEGSAPPRQTRVRKCPPRFEAKTDTKLSQPSESVKGVKRKKGRHGGSRTPSGKR